MIRKIDLVDAINSLDHDMTALAIRVHDLEEKIATLNKVSKTKSEKAKRQVRTKDGKFAKKK